MKRSVAWILMLMGTGLVNAAPARPRYDPPPRATPGTPLSLAGTYWFGKCYADNFWIIFEEQGTINWGYGQLDAKKAGSTGTWRLEGNKVYFEFNRKTLEFQGTTDGQIIQGLTFNNSGSRYVTTLKLTPRPK
ncbi:MAG: hypothetical protein HYX68_28040 [Planctomycetes bacterium]|jgi:hypothetical protein|nr:hypothetical protein [Planctomycetota bacterium]